MILVMSAAKLSKEAERHGLTEKLRPTNGTTALSQVKFLSLFRDYCWLRRDIPWSTELKVLVGRTKVVRESILCSMAVEAAGQARCHQ